MNYHYPKTKKQWSDKTEKKRLMKNLSKDDKKEFEFIINLINLIPIINSREYFDLHNILFDKKLKEIIFDLRISEPNDIFESLPFKLRFIGNLLEEEWENEECKNQIFKNKEFISHIKKYVEMYYLIKTLDLNMDYIKIKIKEIYPDFHKIDCDYNYIFEKDK